MNNNNKPTKWGGENPYLLQCIIKYITIIYLYLYNINYIHTYIYKIQ